MRMNEINLFKIGEGLFIAGLIGVLAAALLVDMIPTDIIAEWVSRIWAVATTLIIGHFGGKIYEILKKRKAEETEEKN